MKLDLANLRGSCCGAVALVDSLPPVDEGVVFQLPAELRSADA